MRRFTARAVLLLALLTFATPIVGVTACALVQSHPSATDVAKVQTTANRIADDVKIAVGIIGAAGTFIDTTPLPTSVKDDVDKAIVQAFGTSSAPGPVYKALDRMKNVTDQPQLKATLTEILSLIDPLLEKLKATGNPGLIGFAISAKAALDFARSLA